MERFYKDRTWDAIESGHAVSAINRYRLRCFAEWRIGHAVDVKRRDAQLLLHAMLELPDACCQAGPLPVLNRTKYWVRHDALFGARRRAGSG